MRNFQRDGHMQHGRAEGPRELRAEHARRPDGPRENPGSAASRSFPRPKRAATPCALRPETFADHYSQARLFFRSQTEPEQNHIVSALVFELSKVETPAIRERVVGAPAEHRDGAGRARRQGLAPAVAAGPGRDGLSGQGQSATRRRRSASSPRPSRPSRAAIVGCLVSDGVDEAAGERACARRSRRRAPSSRSSRRRSAA